MYLRIIKDFLFVYQFELNFLKSPIALCYPVVWVLPDPGDVLTYSPIAKKWLEKFGPL